MRRILVSILLAFTVLSCTPALTTSQPAAAIAQRAGDPNVTVWVNTDSGVYHCPGTRWYGNTKQGKYMNQRAAQASGYRPANGSVCG